MNKTYTREQVSQAANKAANDIGEALGFDFTAGLDLFVNAAMYYLDAGDGNLAAVIADSYDEEYDTVIKWLHE